MLFAIYILPWPHFGVTDEAIRLAEIEWREIADRAHAFVGGGAVYFLIMGAAGAYAPWMSTAKSRAAERRGSVGLGDSR